MALNTLSISIFSFSFSFVIFVSTNRAMKKFQFLTGPSDGMGESK